MSKKDLRVVTPKARLSFADLFEAKSFQGKPAKFSAKLLIPKKTDITALKNAVRQVAVEKWGENLPKGIEMPFKNGDDKDYDGYPGNIVIGASTKFAPQILDADRTPLSKEDADTVYSGCYVKAIISPWAGEVKEKNVVLKRFISFNLIAVQKVAEGEPFRKMVDAAEYFDDESGGSNDSSNYASDDDFMN